MWDALHYEFIRNALIAGILVSISCGIIGTLVVVNRIVFLSGGIAHAAYGGIGIAVYAGFQPFFGAALFGFAASMAMGLFSLKNKERADTFIGVLWAAGMALGILLIDLTPGYHVDLMSYLFGSIMAVPRSDLWYMLLLDCIILFLTIRYYKEFLSMSFDREFAFVAGVPVRILYFTLLGMIAMSVVMVIRVVGLILVIALLTIPPYIAEKYTASLSSMMVLSALLGTLFTLVGLWLSYNYNLASGATIIMVASVAFFLSAGMDALKEKPAPGPGNLDRREGESEPHPEGL